MIIDSIQGGIESLARRLLVRIVCRESSVKFGGVLRLTDEKNTLLEDRGRELW
jgi:hypothetical protein